MSGSSRQRSARRAGRVEPLVRAARAARRRSYSPYSHFAVGAAVKAGGRIFSGCNVENASYGLTLCAERSAVAQAVSAGARRIEAVAVASGTQPPTPPCGMCLQTLAEFAGPDLPVVLIGQGGTRLETTLGALLPRGFSSSYL